MKKHSFYVKCPECGALLDRGERCDCEELSSIKRERAASSLRRKDEARGVEAAEDGNACAYRFQNDRNLQKFYKEWDYA